jgi:hypothetical protein
VKRYLALLVFCFLVTTARADTRPTETIQMEAIPMTDILWMQGDFIYDIPPPARFQHAHAFTYYSPLTGIQ